MDSHGKNREEYQLPQEGISATELELLYRAKVGDQLFTADDLVSVYTRAQALGDGVLIDVTEIAAEAGFRIPVAITRGAWVDCVAWCEEDTKRMRVPQDEEGRLWDVVWMARIAAKNAGSNQPQTFVIRRVDRTARDRRPRLVALVLRIGPGDNFEPVITISLPNED